MKRVTLGNTGIEVTEMCFGTLTVSKLQAGVAPGGVRRGEDHGLLELHLAPIHVGDDLLMVLGVQRDDVQAPVAVDVDDRGVDRAGALVDPAHKMALALNLINNSRNVAFQKQGTTFLSGVAHFWTQNFLNGFAFFN